jgi:hypothetical protein
MLSLRSRINPALFGASQFSNWAAKDLAEALAECGLDADLVERLASINGVNPLSCAMFVDFPILLSMPPYNFTRQEAKQILEAIANKSNVRIPNEDDLWGEPEWTKESTKNFFLRESRDDKNVIVTDRYSGCWAGQGDWVSGSISLYLMTFEIGEVFDKASGATLIRVVWENLNSQFLQETFGAVNCCYSIGLRPSSHPDILLVLDIHCDTGVACDMKFIEFSLKDKTPVAIGISIGWLLFYGLEGVPNQADEKYTPGENPLFNAQAP